MNLSLLLDMAADGFGDRIVVGTRADGLSAARLRELAQAGGARLRGEGAVALIYLDVNGPAFPVALFAAARAGIPVIPLNYRLSRPALAALIARTPGAVAVADAGYADLLAEAGVPARTSAQWLAELGRAAGSDDSAASVEPEESPEQPALIIYTSGSTSEPKGVLLRHHNLCSYVFGTVEFASATAEDAALISVPPYHIAAVANVITNIYAGRRLIVLEQFGGAEWTALVRAESVSHALVVPTMLARILADAHDTALPSLRSLAYGGAAMPQPLIERALRTWPAVDFVNAYGLTETSSTIAVLGPEEHRAALAAAEPAVRARLTSAGRPVPQIEVQIRDETGAPVRPGVVGQIWVRGEQVSGQYVGGESGLDDSGFFHTRDEGHLDADGYLFVRGRADDTIIRGGENIAPAEIEAVLLQHPDVADVVVVGVPDEEWGQRLEAVVVAGFDRGLDPEALREFVRDRLRRSKTPERITVWAEIPRTDTGKLVRRSVLEALVAQRES